MSVSFCDGTRRVRRFRIPPRPPIRRKDPPRCRKRPCHIGDAFNVAKALGLPRYFTGVPCKSGHVCNRITNGSNCVECRKALKRRWKETNPEKYREQRRRLAKTEKGRLRRRKHERARSKVRRLDPAYRKKQRLKWAAKYNRLTPEQKRQRRRKALSIWRERDPAGYQRYRKAKRARGRARRRGATGNHTLDDINLIFKSQKGRCAYFRTCKTRLGDDYHVDHIMPICQDGTNDRTNIQLTCPACNWSKNGQHPVDFAQSLGLLI